MNPNPMQLPPSSRARKIDQAAYWLASAGLLIIPWSFGYWRLGVDGGIACLGIGFLLHCIAMRDWGWLRSPIGMMMGIWILWMAGVVSPMAVTKPFYSFTYAFAWLRYPLCFLSLHWVLKHERGRKLLWIALMLATGSMLIETLCQWITGTSLSGYHAYDGRLTGPMRAPKIGILLTKLSLAFAAMTLLMHPDWLSKKIYFLGAAAFLLLILLVVFATGERMAALLSLSALLIVFIISFFRQAECRRLGFGILAALVILIGSLLKWNHYAQERMEFLITQLEHFATTEYAELFKASLRMWESSPVTGIGLRHFRMLCHDYMIQTMAFYCPNFIHPHNFALEWLAESGAIGLGLFYAMIGVCLWPTLRWLRSVSACHAKAAFAASMVTIAITWVAFFPIVASQGNWNNWSTGLSWFCFGICTAAWQQLASASLPPMHSGTNL